MTDMAAGLALAMKGAGHRGVEFRRIGIVSIEALVHPGRQGREAAYRTVCDTDLLLGGIACSGCGVQKADVNPSSDAGQAILEMSNSLEQGRIKS